MKKDLTAKRFFIDLFMYELYNKVAAVLRLQAHIIK